MSSSVFQASFKYIYLVAFFALLAGFFHPIITNSSFDLFVVGVIVLFVGLAGAIMLYKASTSENKRMVFIGGGFALVTIALFYVLQLTGRF